MVFSSTAFTTLVLALPLLSVYGLFLAVHLLRVIVLKLLTFRTAHQESLMS